MDSCPGVLCINIAKTWTIGLSYLLANTKCVVVRLLGLTFPHRRHRLECVFCVCGLWLSKKNKVARGLVGLAFFYRILLQEPGKYLKPGFRAHVKFQSFAQNLKRPETLRRAGLFQETVLAPWRNCPSRRADFANFAGHLKCEAQEHERNLVLGMDALIIVSSGNTIVVLVWAWMLWPSYALGTRTELWFGHDALVILCSENTNGIVVWAWMLWSS